MSGFQIVILIWLTCLTLFVFKMHRAVIALISLRFSDPDLVDKEVREFRRNDPDHNVFLRAGIDAVKQHNKQEKGSQDG